MNRLHLKKNALNNLKHPLCAPHLCAEFPERIARTTRGFTFTFSSTHIVLCEHLPLISSVGLLGFIHLATALVSVKYQLKSGKV